MAWMVVVRMKVGNDALRSKPSLLQLLTSASFVLASLGDSGFPIQSESEMKCGQTARCRRAMTGSRPKEPEQRSLPFGRYCLVSVAW